ncbi:MAG: MYXO-CTERM sorting domain-containing protein [Nannocystaceae bacterium]
MPVIAPWLAAVALSAALPDAATDPPLAWTPAVPVAHGDVLPRSVGQPGTLYVNFDGAVLQDGCGNDAHRDCSALGNLFDGYVGPFDGTDVQRVAILQAARKDVADFGIRIVTKRPPDEDEYTMILYGALGDQEFAGIAPYIDCGDLWPSDTAFANAYSTSNTGSTVILQEAAHTWGLEHVDAPFDNMHPFKTGGSQSFTDECQKIVSNTDLDSYGGACNAVHQRFCERGYQNSWQELRYLFGPPVPDTSPPTLTITNPEDGAEFALPVTIPLTGVIDDDLDPQAYTITVLKDGAKVFEDEGLSLALLMNDPPAGEYDLTVQVTDEAGNLGTSRVRFTIYPEGTVLPDDQDDGEADSGCRIDGEAGEAGLGLLVLGLVRRRRRRPDGATQHWRRRCERAKTGGP